MMRKMLSAILVFGLVFTMMVGLANSQQNGLDIDEACRISGYVYNSADGIAKIRENDTWTCTNITVYNVSEYEAGIIDLAINNNDTDHGEDFLEKDKFYFDAGEQWANWSWGDTLVSVGETNNGGVNYVFFTSTILISLPANYFEETEWEPIPTPIVYAKGDGWINITVPKFTNPQKELYGNVTTNADNTIGFKVYKDGGPVGNTVSEGTSHYFFNDTYFSSACNYSVSPILKGNYVAYGRSADLSSDESAFDPLNVVLESPNGDEYWAGGSEQNIKYTITGGLAPYNVTIEYSEDGGDTYLNTINTTVKQAEGECTYPWTLPETNPNAVKVKVEVTDDALVSKNDASDSIFVIDSIPPIVESTIPSPDGSVSIKKPITIVFNETMNQIATQAAFSISPDPLGWSWSWNPAGDTMTGTHNDFVFGETYTATITIAAKDLAGNYLANDYSWNFTANMSVSINSPKSGDIWTGGSTHNIEYEITGGVAPYTITIDYTTDGGLTYKNITTTPVNHDAIGLYPHPWELQILDLTAVNVRITLIDANETKSIDSSGNFEIDSTAPTIIAYSGNDTIVPVTASITVWFSEEMNVSSVESAFTLTDSSAEQINGSWKDQEGKPLPEYAKVMCFNANLTQNVKYFAVINTTATDKSDPGNYLDKDYSWNFTAVKGRGDFIVDFDYPLSPEKGKTYSLTVTLYNTGKNSENVSGALTVKFYASGDGKTWTLIDNPQPISNLEKNKSISASVPFTFNDYGAYYFLIEITSDNPTDLFPGGRTQSYTTSASVNILKPGEEIGLGPYTLIALMVVIVIIVAALILLSLKKKGELTLKEKKEGKEEEGEKEEEESEEEEEKG